MGEYNMELHWASLNSKGAPRTKLVTIPKSAMLRCTGRAVHKHTPNAQKLVIGVHRYCFELQSLQRDQLGDGDLLQPDSKSLCFSQFVSCLTLRCEVVDQQLFELESITDQAIMLVF